MEKLKSWLGVFNNAQVARRLVLDINRQANDDTRQHMGRISFAVIEETIRGVVICRFFKWLRMSRVTM